MTTEATNLFLLFLRSFNLQLFIQVISDLLQLVLGVRSERAPELGPHDIDKLEEGCHEFLSVFDLWAGGNREFDDDVLLAFFR